MKYFDINPMATLFEPQARSSYLALAKYIVPTLMWNTVSKPKLLESYQPNNFLGHKLTSAINVIEQCIKNYGIKEAPECSTNYYQALRELTDHVNALLEELKNGPMQKPPKQIIQSTLLNNLEALTNSEYSVWVFSPQSPTNATNPNIAHQGQDAKWILFAGAESVFASDKVQQPRRYDLQGIAAFHSKQIQTPTDRSKTPRREINPAPMPSPALEIDQECASGGDVLTSVQTSESPSGSVDLIINMSKHEQTYSAGSNSSENSSEGRDPVSIEFPEFEPDSMLKR